jgi:spore coat polysaccharide biosynthesis protein SpsF
MKDNLKIIIQARTGSTRLPNKILKPFYGNKTILDILIENLKQFYKEEDIILATSTSLGDTKLKEVASNHGICFFQGDENNVLNRFLVCAEQFKAQIIVRICADNPFLFPSFIQDIINKIIDGKDYASYQWPDGTPVMLSHIGLFAEAFQVSFIKRVSTLTQDPVFTEHVTNYIYSNKEKFDYEFLPIPSILNQSQNLRLTIDTESDFETASEIYQDWVKCEIQDVESLLFIINNKPQLISKMLKEIHKNAK